MRGPAMKRTLGRSNFEAFKAATPRVKRADWEYQRHEHEAWQAAAEAVKAEIATWPVCQRCGGNGRIERLARKPFDPDGATVKCPACDGLGKVEPNE